VRCRCRLAHLDANLCEFDKEGAAPTFKTGYGFHPLGAWCANTAESLAMLLRPGNAGSARQEVAQVEWIHREEVG